MKFQKTIKNKIEIAGIGLHTGIMTKAFFKPAKANTGIKFRRIDLEMKPYIAACIENVANTNRRTVLEENGACVETVEHVLAAVFSLSIDNIIIELDGPEVPILDGSSINFINALEECGLKKLDTEKKQIQLKNYFKVELKNKESRIEFFPDKKLKIEVFTNYNSNVLMPQNAKLIDLKNFKKEIASARTFCFLHELDQLLKLNLIKGADLNNGILFVEEDTPTQNLKEIKKILSTDMKMIPKGVFNNKTMISENEQAKHKLLDLLGDIALAGYSIKGKIVASKPGHTINTLFAKKLKFEIKKQENILNGKPLLGPNEIKSILPHREPFLFIDEITELKETCVTGIKYVNNDEYYFAGHFPGAPVMPGVLQIEAMAQTGGILALNSVPDPENYLTYFMKIDKVKFKRKVEPDCILIFKLNLLSPIRRGICHMEAKAYIKNELVSEAELMAKIVKE